MQVATGQPVERLPSYTGQPELQVAGGTLKIWRQVANLSQPLKAAIKGCDRLDRQVSRRRTGLATRRSRSGIRCQVMPSQVACRSSKGCDRLWEPVDPDPV